MESQIVEKIEVVPDQAQVLADRAVAISKQLEGYKLLYDELDKIGTELRTLKGLGTTNAVLSGGMAVTVVDNFEDTNIVWRPAAARRFEIKVEDSEKFFKRLKKEAKQ